MSREETTLRNLLELLRSGEGSYGYDVWLPNLVTEHTLLWRWAVEVLRSEAHTDHVPTTSGFGRHVTYHSETRERKTAGELYPIAADCLWLLCRRGVLRPGVRDADGQSVSSGAGYSLTRKGRAWVKNVSSEEIDCLLDEL